MTVLNFPPNPEVGDPYEENGVTYTWDGVKWRSYKEVELQAPLLTSVDITDTGASADRFTSEVFEVNPVFGAAGKPAPEVSMKVRLDDTNVLRSIARPQTSVITNVTTEEFVDGFNLVDVNANSWYDITWFGPPWNFYFAYATNAVDGSSQAKSADGINWTEVSTGIFPSTNCRPVYVEKYQRIYWVNHGYSVYWTDDPDLQTYTEAINFGGNSPNAEARINQLQYLPEQDFFVAYREYWTAPNIMRSAVGDGNLSSGWRTQGTVQGYCRGGTIVRPGTNEAMVIMNSYGPANENYQQTVYTQDITASSISWQNPLNGQTANIATDIGGYYDTVARRWVMACTYPVSGTVSWSGDDRPTAANATVTTHNWNIQRMEWFEELGYAVGVGGNSGAAAGYVYIITDGGRQIQQIVTDPVAYNLWRDVIWRPEDPKFSLCGSAGAERFAWSTTLSLPKDLPTLSFSTVGNGLEAFSEGDKVDQSDGSATGSVAGIDLENATMAVNATQGTWLPGQTVLGPSKDVPNAFALIDSQGNVTGIAPGDPGYVKQDGEGPYNVTFPATFSDGTPDELIPAGTAISADVYAKSSIAGFTAETEASSPSITPT